jgi:hypothetical protein
MDEIDVIDVIAIEGLPDGPCFLWIFLSPHFRRRLCDYMKMAS